MDVLTQIRESVHRIEPPWRVPVDLSPVGEVAGLEDRKHHPTEAMGNGRKPWETEPKVVAMFITQTRRCTRCGRVEMREVRA